jgi:signal transduction histidine kinase/ligand-binding sensor domain-containing protein
MACALLVATPSARAVDAQPVSRRLAQMHHTTWGEREGLPISSMVKPMRTPDGYLWLGSADALFRFDGVRFVTFDASTTPELRSAIPGRLDPLMLDSTGVLWIGRPDGALVHYREGAFREAFAADTVRGKAFSMTADRLGRLWVKTRTMYVIRGGHIEAPSLPPAIALRDVQGVVPDTGRGLWIGTRTSQLWHVTAAGAERIPLSDSGSGIRPLLQSRDGTLWVIGQRVHALRNGVWTTLMAPNGVTLINGTHGEELSDGSVVIATRGYGLLRSKDGVVDQFTEAEGLSDAVVRNFLADDDGSLWIATDAGLDRLKPTPFVTISRRDGLPFDAPSAVKGDGDGSMWVRTFGSLPWQMDGGVVRRREGALTFRQIEAPAGTYIFATAPQGGVWLRDGRGRIAHFRDGRMTMLRARGLPSARVHRVLEDRTGAIWLSFYDGTFGVVRDERYTVIPRAGLTPDSHASTIVEDSTGSKWIVVEGPDALYQIAGDSVVRTFTVSKARQGIKTPVVEGGDTVWATADGGLIRIANGRMSTVRIPRAAATLRTSTMDLLLTPGYLWFAGEAGLGRLPLPALHRAADGNGAAPEPEFFSSTDGLPTPKLPNMTSDAAYKADDGRLWFTTPAGIAVVDPATIPAAPRTPQVHLEEVVVSGRQLPREESLRIPPNPERVDIHFTATELATPERVRLQYRLDGADREWVDVSGPRMATYTQLRPGRYHFRVRAWNEGGAPGPDVSMALRVLPAWYQTWWFATLVFLVVAASGMALVYGVFRARSQRAAERMQARFDAELRERTRLARDLHDTLLQGFTGITLQLQAVHDSLLKSPKEAETSLARILELADVSLRDVRSMVWDMRAPELDRNDLGTALEEAAHTAIGAAAITLGFAVEGKSHRLPLDIETTVLRVGREAVANAVKHSGATTIGVTLSYEPSRVSMHVRDNGSGFDPATVDASNNGGHWGVKGMRERATRAGGTLSIDGMTGRGTVLSLSVPYVA